MTLEILFKNGIFFTLFLSMLSFWGENLFIRQSKNPNVDRELGITEDAKATIGGSSPSQSKRTKSFFKSTELTWLLPTALARKLFSEPGFLGFAFFLLSFFFITSELLLRWFTSGHPPLSNLYESLLFFIWGLIGFFLFLNQPGANFIRAAEGTKLSPATEGDREGGTFNGSSQLSSSTKFDSMEVSIRQLGPRKLAVPDSDLKSSFKELGVANEVGCSETWKQPVEPPIAQLSGFSLRNFLGGILSSAALFIETFADWRLPSEMKEMKPLIPALQSNWLLMHVSIMILSYAALLIGCLLAISYIALSVGSKAETNEGGGPLARSNWASGPLVQIPGEVQIGSAPRTVFLTDLDSLSFRILAFGFPLLTLGILSGAVWANEAWGSYWSWDPKETWAFITWLIFAFYLHTRLQYGWEGKKSAFVATFGFFILWICYLGVNLLGKGLHSYGWLS